MKTISFTKIEGTGNDFIVINGFIFDKETEDILTIVPYLCDRRYGIGADGLMILSPPKIEGADYEMIYKNSDGSDAGMCGNGARCLALFASKQEFTQDLNFHVGDTPYKAIVADRNVTIKFPQTIEPEKLSHIKDGYYCYAGTEHVVLVKKFEKSDMETSFAKRIRYDSSHFPNGTNVNFLEILDNSRCKITTYERGVEDYTLACGTGAISSAITAASIDDSMQAPVTVNVEGGHLIIDFKREGKAFRSITLTGEANISFTGEFIISNYLQKKT